MGTGTLLAAILSLAPMFESMTNRPIIMANTEGKEIGIEVQTAFQNAVCSEFGISPCNIPKAELPDYSTQNGSMQITHVRMNDRSTREACLIGLPHRSGSQSFGFVYTHTGYFSHSAIKSYYDPSVEDVRALNLLMQFSGCLRSPSGDAQRQRERDAAFAIIMLQLLKGDPGFLKAGGDTTAHYTSAGLGTQSAAYANGVAQRILAEEYKKNIYNALHQRASGSTCSVTLQTSKQPLMGRNTEAPRPDYAASGARGERQVNTSPSEQILQQIKDCGRPLGEKGRNGVRLVVSDALLKALASSEVDTLALDPDMRKEDEFAGLRNMAFRWRPYQNFNGSANRAFNYAWNTANTLVGIN